MASQVGIINNNNGSNVDWDWSNVTVPCAEDRASAGGYGGDDVAQIATEYQMGIPNIIDMLVDNEQENATGCNREELESMVCTDFRNVLDALNRDPYAIVAICEALGIESNIKG